MNVSTTYPVMVFKNIEDGKITYSLGISKKVENEDGTKTYQNAYIPVRFKKGIEPEEERTKINIVNGFITFSQFENEEGKKITYKYIMVMDYSEAEDKPKTSGSITQDEIELGDDDLPF